MELHDILSHESRRPGFRLRDAAKLLYQSEFGGGHLIADPASALAWLKSETAGCEITDEPLISPIGGGFCRVNLAPAAGRISPETLCRIFVLSSRRPAGDLENFKTKLALLYRLTFDPAEVDTFLTEYAAQGYPMLSHSESYRAANRPAYRVIRQEYARFLDVFSGIDRFSRFAGPVVVGIDGMCASGKSTLGAMLAEVYDGNLFHADDYFLPVKMRTAHRLSESGGNMHRERLLEEVLLPLERGAPVVTRRFDCGKMALEAPVEHTPRRVNIVEGSYSLHPALRDFYTLKIALRTAPDTQLDRLKARDPGRIYDYVNRWLPLENRYFDASGMYAAADLVIET